MLMIVTVIPVLLNSNAVFINNDEDIKCYYFNLQCVTFPDLLMLFLPI